MIEVRVGSHLSKRYLENSGYIPELNDHLNKIPSNEDEHAKELSKAAQASGKDSVDGVDIQQPWSKQAEGQAAFEPCGYNRGSS